MGRGFGFGKVILFGEHFVVHGIPGIVTAIDSITEAVVKKNRDHITIIDQREGAKGYTTAKKIQQRESIERMLTKMGLRSETASMQIWLGGALPGFSGIGASAASSVAIARAIDDEFEMKFSAEQINEFAFEAEKAYAGTPSGIDNTAATYGGLLWFKRDLRGGPNIIEKMSIREPVEIVIGNTGIVADTKRMVAGVTKRKKENPEKYGLLFTNAEELVVKAKKALKDFDLKKVGMLMNANHILLQKIGVSCNELDNLVSLAREQGALGAKLTGGGGGGCMVALTPGIKLQEVVASAIKKDGYAVLKTTIGIHTSYIRGEFLKRSAF